MKKHILKNHILKNNKLENKIDKKSVISGFNRAAISYDKSAILQNEVCDRLLERLQWIKLEPKFILDLGSGTGYAVPILQKMYPHAKIIALDIAQEMLIFARNKYQVQNTTSLIQRISQKLLKEINSINYTCADAENLPFKNQTFDLIFSSLAIQWCEDTQGLFSELQRVLKPKGCLLFSSFGVDTLTELKQSWMTDKAEVVSQHVNDFIDMHELGDAMLQSGLADPVMDSEMIVMEYAELNQLFKDLKQIGAQNHLSQRCKGLTTKTGYQLMLSNYKTFKLDNGKYPATYEVLYGHAWGRELTIGAQSGSRNVTEHPIKFITKN